MAKKHTSALKRPYLHGQKTLCAKTVEKISALLRTIPVTIIIPKDDYVSIGGFQFVLETKEVMVISLSYVLSLSLLFCVCVKSHISLTILDTANPLF